MVFYKPLRFFERKKWHLLLACKYHEVRKSKRESDPVNRVALAVSIDGVLQWHEDTSSNARTVSALKQHQVLLTRQHRNKAQSFLYTESLRNTNELINCSQDEEVESSGS